MNTHTNNNPASVTTQSARANLDDLARLYAQARETLNERVDALDAELGTVTRRRIGGIKAAARDAASLAVELRTGVEGAPELFTRPRTMTLHGVTLGYRKGPGKLQWDDDAKVVAMIRRHLPKQAEELIITQEKPSAEALKQVDARELARLGVRMAATGDQVVVKSEDGAHEKLVAQILAETAEGAAKGETNAD